MADGSRKRKTRSAQRAAQGGAGRATQSRRLAEVLRKFRVLFKSSQRHARWVETAYGVSPAQLWALTEIGRSPALRVADLALSMSLHVSTASNLLDKLERKALLSRARDRQDQRIVRLHLTAAGRRMLAKAQRVPSALLPDALARLPDALLGDLDRAMTRLLNDLAFKDEDAAFEPLNRA
ncbi:MAG TPA: MarR family transcriptional regulator [Burkholderiales bacterium]|nr:MarR family transcriptional regulator [Burkholderiales bacterium]